MRAVSRTGATVATIAGGADQDSSERKGRRAISAVLCTLAARRPFLGRRSSRSSVLETTTDGMGCPNAGGSRVGGGVSPSDSGMGTPDPGRTGSRERHLHREARDTVGGGGIERDPADDPRRHLAVFAEHHVDAAVEAQEGEGGGQPHRPLVDPPLAAQRLLHAVDAQPRRSDVAGARLDELGDGRGGPGRQRRERDRDAEAAGQRGHAHDAPRDGARAAGQEHRAAHLGADRERLAAHDGDSAAGEIDRARVDTSPTVGRATDRRPRRTELAERPCATVSCGEPTLGSIVRSAGATVDGNAGGGLTFGGLPAT